MSQFLLLNRRYDSRFWDMLCEKWDMLCEKWDMDGGGGGRDGEERGAGA